MRVVSSSTLAKGRFEGGRYGPTTISMILDEEPPGGGPRLICTHASPTIATEFVQ